MNFSLLASLDGTFKSFFASLATSISYDIVLYAALAVQIFIIIIFAVKSKYSYEMRMTKSLDKLNRWLFHYKSITKDNVKEFTNLVKKAPKRLTYNWQQYILYRDKAPSEYMSIDNIIDKPLRTSSYTTNVKNMNIISFVWTMVVLLVAFALNWGNDALLSVSIILSSLVIPLFLAIILVFANILFSAKKASNLDELYQNLHLFNRFVDNACTELPKYIDYSLLFTNQEIERGIPELREYYENRARKEKEEFERAQAEEEKFEQYDFSAVGIDGSNILDRALKECELFLNKKAKILTSIAERESSLESLKKSFDNVQKEFQKKMQVSKENVDRLRQQQEETTSRIEGNFLRRQMESTIAKQENEEAEYENQRRNYISQKAEYEDQIKNLNEELEKLKDNVTVAMESEYETFYEKLFKASVLDAEEKVKEKFNSIRDERDNYEEELTDSQTKLKRLIDENETLRNKLGITETSEILVEKNDDKKKIKDKKQQEELFFDHSNDKPVENKVESEEEGFSLEEESEEPKKEEPVKVEESENFALEEESEEENAQTEEVENSEENAQPFELSEEAEYEPIEEEAETNESEQTVQPLDLGEEDEYESVEEESEEEPDEDNGESSGNDVPAKPKKSRGRPKGTTKVVKPTGPKKSRGRPKGTTKVEPKPAGEKKGRGRPKKVEGLDRITQRINEEQQRMIEAQETLNQNLKEAVQDLDEKSIKAVEREKINAEIAQLKERARLAKETNSSGDELEEINKNLEELIQKLKNI